MLTIDFDIGLIIAFGYLHVLENTFQYTFLNTTLFSFCSECYK